MEFRDEILYGKKLLPKFALSRGKTTLMSEIFASKAIREIFRISREFNLANLS